MSVAHLGKTNFPQPSDMDKAYIESVHPTVLPELKSYVELCLEHALNPNTEREKIHTLHIVSLIRLTTARIHFLTTQPDETNLKAGLEEVKA